MALHLAQELSDVKARVALSLVAGVVSSLGFAPVSVDLFLIVGLMGFFWLVQKCDGIKDAVLTGLSWGIGFYGLGLQWTYHSMNVYGGIPALVCIVLIIVLASYLSVFQIIFAIFCVKINLRKEYLFLFVMPALWAIVEWLRGEVITSFGWLGTGYAFADNLLAAYAPIGAVYLVSFVVALISCCVLVLLEREAFRPGRLMAAFALGMCVLGAYGLNDLDWTKPGSRLEVRLVQPALPVVTRPSFSVQERALARVEQMSQMAPVGRRLDLILWPESVYVTSLQRMPPEMRSLAHNVSSRTGATVLFNAFNEPIQGDFRNSFWIADEHTRVIYSKRHLVPFGEYVPFGFRWFVDMMGIPMADQHRGEKPKQMVPVLGHPIAPGICYENLFTSELRDWFLLETLPEVVVYNANLSWFGEAATHQFTKISQMRARETARPVIQVVNGGGSASILPNGEIDRRAGSGAQNLDLTLTTVRGAATPVMRFGLTPTLIFYLSLIVIGLLFRRKKCSLASGVCNSR